MPLSAYMRLLKAGFVIAREGVFGLLPDQDAPVFVKAGLKCAHLIARRNINSKTQGERLTTALNRLGPSYIKLGQFLATRPDIVGAEMAKALGALHDEVPPFDVKIAQRIIEESLGQPMNQLFSGFGAPVAAASIAQVHKVYQEKDQTTQAVAVKVLRPNVRRRFQKDLTSFYAGARFLEWVSPQARRLRLVAVVDILARSVALEMDMRLEAAALSEMMEISADDPQFSVPAVDWARTSRNVLTTQWVDGIKLSDMAGIDRAGIDRKALSVHLIQTFLRHALEYGFFHADMHPGNLFVDDQGRLMAVDFGIMGRIGMKERRFLAEILYGFIVRDYQRIAEVHFEAGYVPPQHSVADFASALRAVGEPIHGQTAEDISMAQVLGLLFEITELFDMQTRTELLLLQKTMVVVEGVARSLNKEFDMWQAAEPVLRDWLAGHMGPVARLNEAKDGLSALGRLLATLPILAEHVAALASASQDVCIGQSCARKNRARKVFNKESAFLVVTMVAALALLFHVF